MRRLQSPARFLTIFVVLPLGLAVLLAPVGCSAPRPEPEDWLAWGFRSPSQTFRTFLTALAGDRPELEYRCLSARLKRAEGISSLAYREYRDELLGKQPWLRRAACAEIVEEIELGPHRRRLIAHVDTLFVDRTFAVELVREDFYELWAQDELLGDDSALFERLVREGQGPSVEATTPLPPGTSLSEITELRVGQDWKIDAFLDEAPATETDDTNRT